MVTGFGGRLSPWQVHSGHLGRHRRRGIAGPKLRSGTSRRDAGYVADVDVLVSWNFRHIVRLDKIRLFNAVNIEQGYKPVSIYSPREVISYGQED